MHGSSWPDEKSEFQLLRGTRQACTTGLLPALAARFQTSRSRMKSFLRSRTSAARQAGVEDATSTPGNRPFELSDARKETAQSRGRSRRAAAYELPASWFRA